MASAPSRLRHLPALGGHSGAQPGRSRGAVPRRARPLDDAARDHRGGRRLHRPRRRAPAPRRPRADHAATPPVAAQPAGAAASAPRSTAASPQATGDPLLLLNSDAEVTEGGDHRIREAFADGCVRAGRHEPRSRGGASRLPERPAAMERRRLSHPALALRPGERPGPRGALPDPQGAALAASRGGAVDWAPGAALAISRAAFETVGPFDESYRHYAQDLDYCQRLAERRAARCGSSPTGSSCTTSAARSARSATWRARILRNRPVSRRTHRSQHSMPPAPLRSLRRLRRPAPRPALARPAALGAPAPRRAPGRAGRAARCSLGGRLRQLRLARGAARPKHARSMPRSPRSPRCVGAHLVGGRQRSRRIPGAQWRGAPPASGTSDRPGSRPSTGDAPRTLPPAGDLARACPR